MRGTEEIIFKNLLIEHYKQKGYQYKCELKVGKCVVDFVAFNDELIAYEIKSSKDNLSRLKNQIKEYSKAFALVNIITSKNHLKKILEYFKNTSIGIIVLENGVFVEEQKAIKNLDYLEHKTIFSMLRKKEFETLVIKFYGKLPNTTDFTHYNKCYEMIEKIPINQVYSFFILCINERNYNLKRGLRNAQVI